MNKSQKLVDKFNSKFKVGDKVLLRKWVGGDYEEHIVKSEAFDQYGQAVAFFESISGYFSIEKDFIKY